MADTLSKLAKPIGSSKDKLRKGRGVGSGLGKTAGRGSKGQYARNGVRREFEVNVGMLETFDAGTNIDETLLRDRGFVKGRIDRIKILGNGDLKKKITITAHGFSKLAVEKIEKAGGKALIVSAIVEAK